MDFHALPRRDLQALCKRNSIRANMTNAAMADALVALPAVDGIEEYIKQPAAPPTSAAKPAVEAVAEQEKTGTPLQLGRCVTFKPPEPITREDGEKEDGDLKPDGHENRAPARCAGRRGAGRRARPEPVAAAPATRRRGAGKKTEACDTAAEAMPVAELTPAAKPTADAVAEEETQGIPIPRFRCVTFKSPEPVMPEDSEKQDADEDDAPARGARRRGANRRARPEPVAAAPATRRRGAGKKTEACDAAAEAMPVAELTPASKPAVGVVAEEEKQGIPIPGGRCVTFKSPEPVMPDAGEKFNGDLNQDEKEGNAPAIGAGRRGASRRARPEPVAAAPAPATRRRAAASKTEAEVVAVPARTTYRRSQKIVVTEEEVLPAIRTTRRTAARKADIQQEEGEEPQGVVSDAEITAPAPGYDKGRGDPQDTEQALYPLNEESNEVVEESSKEYQADTGAAMDTPIPVEEDPAEECTDMLEDVQQCAAHLPNQEDSPTPVVLCLAELGEEGVSSEDGPLYKEMSHSTEDMELVPISGAPQDTLTSREAPQDIGFTGDGAHTSEEDEVANFAEVNANEAGTEEKEEVAVVGVLHDTDEVIVVDLSGNISRAVVEEVVVATEKMQEISETMEEAVEATMVTADDMSQVTVTDGEDAGKENADEAGTEEKVDVAVVEVLHDTVTGFDETNMVDLYGSISRAVVEEEVVVATEKMQEISETMEEAVEATMVTADDMSQVTVTDGEDAGKENADEAGTEEKVDVAVVEVLHDTVTGFDETNMVDLYGSISRAVVEEEVVVDTEKMPESSETKEEGVEAIVTADNVSQVVTETNREDAGKENTDDAGSEEKEDVAVVEVLHETTADFDESIMVDLSGNTSRAVVEEEVVVATENMAESSETMEEGVEAMVTAYNVSQVVTVTDREDAGKENADEAGSEEKEDVAVVEVLHETTSGFDESIMVDLSGNISWAVVEEEATENMAENSETMEEGVEAMVTADNVSQVVTVIGEEDAGKENASEAGTEDKDVGVVEVLHDTVAGFDEASMFDLYGNISRAVVEEELVVATDKMPESSETLEEAVEAMVTAGNVSQVVTVTGGEDAGKESAFTGDLTSTPVFHTSRDFNDHITSPLSAGMLDDASLLVDSMIIVEPTMAENQDVLECTYNNSGGEEMDKMLECSTIMDEGVQAVVTVTDEDSGKKSAFSSDHTSRDLNAHITSPLPDGMLGDASLLVDSMTIVDAMAENQDVSGCTYHNSGGEKMDKMTECSATVDEGAQAVVTVAYDEDAGKKSTFSSDAPPVLDTSRYCSDVMEEREESPALGELSLRKLRMKLKETSRDCSDVSLCVYSNIGSEKNINEPVAAEEGKEVEEDEEYSALGELKETSRDCSDVSLCVYNNSGSEKNVNELVAAEQGKEVEEDEESMALDKLSLRKLKIKWKETLMAQQGKRKREGKRVALGRLNENVC